MPVAVVRLREELLGIDLKVVREVAEVRGITPIPCCPAHILGMISRRGDLFTLVDLGAVLGLPPWRASAGARVMLLDIGDLGIGIPVDEVLDVRDYQPEELAPAPAASRPKNAAFILGTLPFGSRMLSVLHLPRIFAQERLTVNEGP
jgi:purine-binding chemotaxis protein CheW